MAVQVVTLINQTQRVIHVCQKHSATTLVKHALLLMILMLVTLAMPTPVLDLKIDPPGVIVTTVIIHHGLQITVSHTLQHF